MSRDLLSINQTELPAGWEVARMSEIANINYRDPSIKELPDQTLVTFVPMAAIDAQKGIIAEPTSKYLIDVKSGYSSFKEGDVLFAKITPSMENGKAAIARGLINGIGFGSTEYHVLKPKEGIIPEWLFYFIRQKRFREEAKAHFAGTVGQLRVPKDFLEKREIPIAPLQEQIRIVLRIEELLTLLDVGVATLERAQANLERYKASVLKAACEGRLVPTEAELARKEGRDYETASVLLQRILAERREKWEEAEWAKLVERAKKKAAQAKRKSTGRPARISDLAPKEWQELSEEEYEKFLPKDEKWKGKYKEPEPLDTNGLLELPEEWVWANIELLSDGSPYALKAGPFGSSLKKSFYVPSGFKVYGQEQVIRGDPYYGDYYIDASKYHELRSCAVKPGDMLVSLVGTIGKVLILPEDIEPGIINPRLLKLSLSRSVISAKYFKIYMESESAKDFFALSSHGGTMEILNMGIMEQLPIPLPPLQEQERITEKVDELLSIGNDLARAVSESKSRVANLKQAILVSAFSGSLVPQNPEEEPAEALLSRITKTISEGNSSYGQ